jgi:hypothetical protein
VKDLPEIVEHLKGGPVVERLLVSATSEEEIARKTFYTDLLAIDAPLSFEQVQETATSHNYDDAWINEQMRRGFLAKKVNQESGDEFYQVTKKSRVRYGSDQYPILSH